MRELNRRQRKLLAGFARNQRYALVSGLLLCCIGVAYIVWAVLRFDPLADPARDRAFDAPLTQRIATLHSGLARQLDRHHFQTEGERVLAWQLRRSVHFSVGLLVAGYRAVLGLLAVVLGLATLTILMERRQLMKIIHILQDDIVEAQGGVAEAATP